MSETIVRAEDKKVNKTLTQNKFNIFETSVACIAFILFQLVFDLLRTLIPDGANSLLLSILIILIGEGLFAAAVFTASAFRKVNVKNATNINKKTDGLSILLAIAMSLICLFAFTGLTNVFVLTLGKFGYTQVISDITIPNFGIYLLYVVLSCACPAFFEEFLFRGTICSGLKKLGTHKAVYLSALIFMLMHGGPDQTVHQFILGVILGYAFVYSGSLWVPVLIHFINNFVAVTMVYIQTITSAGASEEVAETVETSFGTIALSLVFALFMAAIGGVLVWLCIRGLKKLKAKREQKEREARIALLDKKDITSEDILNLKKQLENVDESDEEATSTVSENIELNKKKSRLNIYTIILYTLSGVYLVLQWILTLVAGLLSS